MVLGLAGTAGVVVSMFLSWRTGSVEPSDIPFAFLFDSTTTSNSPSILVALIPFAVILGLGALLPRAAARACSVDWECWPSWCSTRCRSTT